MTPKGWRFVELGGLLGVLPGFPFKSQSFSDCGDHALPLIRIRDLLTHRPNTYYTGDIPDGYLISKGNILIGMDGDFNICAWEGPVSLLNQRLCKVWSANELELDDLFLFYRLQPELLLLNRRISGTTVKHLSVKHLTKLRLILPPLSEQKKIAAILGSVDEAIAVTQAVIDQTRRVKQGLLAQLLSCGEWQERFGGALRNDIALVNLDQVAVRGTGHTPDREEPEYWDGGVKWVSLRDSSRLDRVFISSTVAEISDAGIRNSSAVIHPKGTVILSRDAGVGKSAILADNMAVSQHFVAWTCGEVLNPHYLYYWLQRMKPVFEMIAIGNTIKTIGMPFFRNLKVPLPCLEEQSRAANVLLSMDQRVLLGEGELQRLGALKRGLMQDLLTGRVRVNGVS